MNAVIRYAPSTDAAPRKSAATDCIKRRLDVAREQRPLWLPVAFRAGAAARLCLPSQDAWIGWLAPMAALAAAALGFQFGGRARQILLVAALAKASEQAWAWWRAETVAA
jgi:hypothetical protein